MDCENRGRERIPNCRVSCADRDNTDRLVRTLNSGHFSIVMGEETERKHRTKRLLCIFLTIGPKLTFLARAFQLFRGRSASLLLARVSRRLFYPSAKQLHWIESFGLGVILWHEELFSGKRGGAQLDHLTCACAAFPFR